MTPKWPDPKASPGRFRHYLPVTEGLLEFLELTGARWVRLRADLYWRLCDELTGKDQWLRALNGIPVYLGNADMRKGRR